MQNATGELLFWAYQRWVNTFLKQISTGQYLFMSSRLNLKCKMAHFEGKTVNHASREMPFLEGCILNDAKLQCQLLARTMHQSYLLIFKVIFLKTFASTKIDFVIVFG